jgi:pimeloyl-ACP methyl ester carboxylesterase
VRGEGPPLVLAHGFGGSARNWGPQVRALAASRRVLVYDARGHARSDAPTQVAAYAPEALAGDLARVLDEHAPGERAVVGGLSLGAGIALRFALEQPERLRGLVLMAPPPGRDPAVQGGWAREFADAIEREGLEAAGERYAWGERSGLDPAAGRLVRQGFLEHPPHALVHVLRAVLDRWPSAEELAPRLRRLALPVLVIVGERDRLSLAMAERLAQEIPGARLEVVPGAGHVVNLAARERVNGLLADFLARLP